MSPRQGGFGPGTRTILTVAAIVIIIGGMRIAGSVIVPMMLAAFISIAVTPLVRWLTNHRVPGPAAVALTVVAMVLGVSVVVSLVATSTDELLAALPRYHERLRALRSEVNNMLLGTGLELPTELAVTNPDQFVGLVGKSLTGIGRILSQLLLVLVIAVFILMEVVALDTKLLSLGDRPTGLTTVTQEIQTYLLVKTGTSTATGVILGVWVSLLNVDFAFLWGAVALVLNFVPAIGSIIAAGPPVVVALLQHGPGTAVGVAIGFLAVNISIGNFMEPRIMGRTFGLSPLVVLLSIIFWGWALGPMGALLSVPLTMVVKIALDANEDLHWLAVLLGSAREQREQHTPRRRPKRGAIKR